jgi:hypothetical protein
MIPVLHQGWDCLVPRAGGEVDFLGQRQLRNKLHRSLVGIGPFALAIAPWRWISRGREGQLGPLVDRSRFQASEFHHTSPLATAAAARDKIHPFLIVLMV